MIPALIAAGGSLLGGILGSSGEASARRRAREAYMQAIGALQGADVETGNAWENAGEASPEGREAQLRALAGFQNIADQRGMDTVARQQLQQAMGQTAMAEKAQRSAVLQNMAARNVASSGDELAANLGAVQSGANALSGAGAQAAAGARGRQMQALQSIQQGGWGLRGQDQSWKGRGLDASNLIGMFNAGQRWNKAQGISGAYQGMGNLYTKQGERAGTWPQAMGSAAGNMAGFAWNQFGPKPGQGQDQEPEDLSQRWR